MKSKMIGGLLLLVSLSSVGQMEEYQHMRELKGVDGQWHKIVLPDEMFGDVSKDLSDIRIYGITAGKDTIEAPYFLRRSIRNVKVKEVSYNTINTTHNNKGHFFTFEIPDSEPVNLLKLDFQQENFDWRITLEGTHNQLDWFTIIENYRILSVKNGMTDYQFTKISFPSSMYRFLRLKIDSEEKPGLRDAKISEHKLIEGRFRTYPITSINRIENKRAKQTEIDVSLAMPVPVSHIRIDVKDTFDYYRWMTIKAIIDSVDTEKGWVYRYKTLSSGTLTSIEDKAFTFSDMLVQKLKFVIHNQDNQPLDIDTIEVKGAIHEIFVRFAKPATYYLVYGSNRMRKPSYDIGRFTDSIPESPKVLTLGDERTIERVVRDPLFINKSWLWAVMSVIILLLGWFTVKMMGKKR